jgi:putative membrane protein (TIGR04086 family)
MEEKGFYVKVGKGVLRATIITVILLIILAVVMSMLEINQQIISVYYLFVTCISIIYGAIYAARKNNRKGWLVGLIVAMLYMIVLYIISAIFFNDTSFGLKDLFRVILALIVGILSGMLGINL